MAEIAPFQGLRYDLTRVGDASRVLSPPYDVISEAERLDLEARHPQNVVRIELPHGEGDARYNNAAGLLDSWIAEGVLRRDSQPALYRYEQQFSWPSERGQAYTRKGFIGLLKLEPFEARVVLPHEHTLSAPKEDRRKLMRATKAHISQIFGLFRDPEGATIQPFAAVEGTAPVLDATTPDGCRHRMWALTDRTAIARVAEVLRDRQILIADGHHRYETMVSLSAELRPRGRPPGRSAADWGTVFLARAEDPGLLVLPTHRLVKNLPDFNMVALRAAAAPAFEIWQTADGAVSPGAASGRLANEIEERLTREGKQRVVFAVRAAGETETTWLALREGVDLSALGPPALRRLDVTVLHGVLLAPLLGIDAGAMAKQSYLGYTHNTTEAINAVSAGEVQGAFMMNATKVEDVLQACEAGFVLPQKSTYFQPKLATGLVINKIDPHAEIVTPR
ncbi:MAG TPA: DUF1015 domain-containing protein [Polyangia bacterium]|nr:DUF1015 domain-containing protein [Polyangia bacterium]